GGQQQRVSIGRAIAKNPDIIIADEPTGALDYKSSKEVLSIFEKINQKYQATIIMVTHNAALKEMADRVITLKDGVIVSNEVNNNKKAISEIEW
ncbi:MAG: ATP-binding cassette domain-containing protein, partial [Bacteroidales bacterium]|nr:ATP-binding cassette domain-containing protein [Bacteroidales bacterium]